MGSGVLFGQKQAAWKWKFRLGNDEGLPNVFIIYQLIYAACEESNFARCVRQMQHGGNNEWGYDFPGYPWKWWKPSFCQYSVDANIYKLTSMYNTIIII